MSPAASKRPSHWGAWPKRVDESHVYQESVDLPDGAVRILDLWCRVQGEEFSAEAGKATAVGRLLISMFCSMEDGGDGVLRQNRALHP